MVNQDPLFFHQHENVHEKVMELLHAVLKAQQLLLSGGDNSIYGRYWSKQQ